MLEHYANQASGLLGLGCQSGPRLIAMVSHGDEQAELPLLWQICLALVNFGYPVTVLDATTSESETNPGLVQLLEDAHWPEGDRHDATWTVMPASMGIRNLCAQPSSKSTHLQQLGHLFPVDGVVVLYCRVDWMLALMGGCDVEPVVAVSPARTSLLTSYMALKRLLITGRVKPTIVNMIQEQGPTSPRSSASAGLRECARKFLGREVQALDIREPQGDVPLHGEIQRLALRLLESAVPLRADPFSLGDARDSASEWRPIDPFAGSH